MHTNPRHAAIAVLLSLVPGWIAAQGPVDLAPGATAAFTITDGRARTDIAADGTVWAAGERWKAGFGRDGVTFVPFLGSELPSQPVRFAFAGATVAGRQVACEAADAALRGAAVDYRRGGLVESYRLDANGIEQTFRFDTLPARGELAVELAVATDLAYTTAATAAGCAFLRAEGGVGYGGATAIDAAGRRRSLVTQWSGSALRIVVPADFVAVAELPLLIDPVIGTVQTVQTSTAALSNVGLAYDASLGRFYACYERAFSATDHDVYVAMLDIAMQFQSLLTIDFTSTHWTKPRIAAVEASDAGCVIAETSTANASPFGIRCRIFTGGPVVSSLPAQTITLGTYHDCHDPDIAGDRSGAAGSRFLITWEEEGSSVNNTDLSLAHLDDAGNVVYVAATLPLGIGMKRRPRLSHTFGAPGGNTEGFALVYRHESYQQSNGNLRAAFFDQHAQLRTVNGAYYTDLTAATSNFGSEFEVSEPSDHAVGRFLVCAERRYNLLNGTSSIVAIPFDRFGARPYGEVLLASGTHDRRAPEVACDGRRFAIAYQEIYSATDSDVRVRTLRLTAAGAVQDDVAYVTTGLEPETEPAICAMPDRSNRYGLAWQHQTAVGSALEAQVYRGVANGGFSTRTTGCGGLYLQASGEPAIGETATFSLPIATGLRGFVVGAPVQWPVAACPGCTQGANGATLVANTLVIAIPPMPAFVGMTLAVQGFEFLPSGQPCLGQVAISNTIDLTIQ